MEAVRTCIGCRKRATRETLLRVVVQESTLIVDEGACLPGRGAWLHDTEQCVRKALVRNAFVRALRVSGPLDTQTIEKRLNGYGNKVNGSK